MKTAPRRTEDLSGIIGEETKSQSVAIAKYKSQAQVNPPTQLNGNATLEIEVKRAGERALLFELSRSLQIKKVEADGQPIEYIHNQAIEGTQLARRGNDLVAAVFPEPLRVGQKIQLHFTSGVDIVSEKDVDMLY